MTGSHKRALRSFLNPTKIRRRLTRSSTRLKGWQTKQLLCPWNNPVLHPKSFRKNTWVLIRSQIRRLKAILEMNFSLSRISMFLTMPHLLTANTKISKSTRRCPRDTTWTDPRGQVRIPLRVETSPVRGKRTDCIQVSNILTLEMTKYC